MKTLWKFLLSLAAVVAFIAWGFGWRFWLVLVAVIMAMPAEPSFGRCRCCGRRRHG